MEPSQQPKEADSLRARVAELEANLKRATSALQQSERVPLTDLQIDECLPLGVAGYSTLVGADEIRAFARAVEFAHGIGVKKGGSNG